MKTVGVLLTILTLGGVTVAQTPAPRAPAAGTGLILGQIVDAGTGKGVSGAIVTLGSSIPVPSQIGELVEIGTTPAATGRRVLTSADGRFLFRDLPKGRYALTATAPGFAPSTFGQGRPLAPGQTIDLDDAQRLGGVTLRAWKFGSIGGTVLDERGEPAVSVTVRCLKRVIAGGQPRFSPQGVTSVVTDDRGTFRSANLVPGDYVCGTTATAATVPLSALDVSDSGQPGNANNSEAYRMLQASGGRGDSSGYHAGDLIVRMSPPPAAGARMMTYLTQYFPAALTTKDASIITLKPGEDRSGVDLQLRLVPAVQLSGRVAGPNGPAAFLGLVLFPATAADLVSDGTAESARTISDAAGSFTFAGIAPGQYIIKVRMFPQPQSSRGAAAGSTVDGAPVAPVDIGQAPAGSGTMGRGGPPPPPPPDEPSLWATVPVTVGETDVSGIAVTLRTGIRVSGRVEFTGARPQPVADAIQRMTIRMQTAEGRTSSPIPAEGRAAADLTFRTTGYAGGRYVASVINTTVPGGWTLRSVTYNGKDISVDPVELADADITGVVMTFTDQATELSGTVTTRANTPDPASEVIVFPADSTAWRDVGVVARRWRDERVTPAGMFAMTGLPPGEYFVAAVAIDAPDDPRDPKVLQALMPSAMRVTLSDGEKKTITVRKR